MHRAFCTHGGMRCAHTEHIGAMTDVKSTEKTTEQEDVWDREQTSE